MQYRQLIVLLTFLVAFLSPGHCGLQIVSDESFLESLRNEYLLAFFTKPNCEECSNLEQLVDKVAEPLADELKLQSVKLVNSQLARLYSPSREPAIIFFRHGIGMLVDVDDLVDEAALYHKLVENTAPSVKELTDATFEHLTQASTGSTTGDWFVHFYNQQCVECQRLSTLWEGVAVELKHRMNVARVNADLGGVETGKRFNVQKVPEFILVRQGKFYKYEIKKYDIKSFTAFATQGFKNAKANVVRTPSTSFDNLVAKSVVYLKYFVDKTSRIRQDQPYFFITAITLLLIFCGLVFARKRKNVAVKKAQRSRRRRDKSEKTN